MRLVKSKEETYCEGYVYNTASKKCEKRPNPPADSPALMFASGDSHYFTFHLRACWLTKM